MRRLGRRLEREGGRVRMTASEDELERDVRAFLELHHGRWEDRGGSSLAGPVEQMLVDAGRALLPSERFRLWTIEVEGRPISAQLFLAAGSALHYFNGGFDPEWAQAKPGFQGILAAVRDALTRGERSVDFGGGDDEYKRRFATGDHPLTWTGLVPRDRRYPVSRARLASKQLDVAGRKLGRRIPAGPRRALKRALGR
jgi:CelD/BcsL family acetyltransferase involved in cellulose biosynthesis